MNFKILTVGWEPELIRQLLIPVRQKLGIEFIHGLVGDASRIEHAAKSVPTEQFISLSKSRAEALPQTDLGLLSCLESDRVPTIRSMIQGDRVLRHRNEGDALRYATLLTRNLEDAIKVHQPDLVLGSHDSIHAGIGLAVSKKNGIPWVTMVFTVIPDNLTWFSKGLTPDQLVSTGNEVTDELRAQASSLLARVRGKKQAVLAYRPPETFLQKMKWIQRAGKNLTRRIFMQSYLGSDLYTFPTVIERTLDIFRRAINRNLLPVGKMIKEPPSSRYAYFPLHMAPESMIDTWAPFYQDQIAFVRQLSLSLPIDLEFVVKLHFSDPDNYSREQLHQLMRLPRLRIAHPNAPGAAFLEGADLVIGIQGTSSLEAALLGKSVLMFGDSPYLHFPHTERAKRPDELYSQIKRMLEKTDRDDSAIIDAYATYLSRYMPGRINDWSRPITPVELERYVACFASLKDLVRSPGAVSNWYD